MALVVLLRGVNVGGHRTFRPSRLAHDLREFDVVNIGSAGTFVVRQPGVRARFRAALLRHLPVTTQVVFCEGRDLVRLERSQPFGPPPADPGSPGRQLDRLDDPIRFNQSDLASFSPLGAATAGSVYLTDGRSRLAAVRVFNRTGKVRVLVYDPKERVWRD